MAENFISCSYYGCTTNESNNWNGGWTEAKENESRNHGYLCFNPPNTTGLSNLNTWTKVVFSSNFNRVGTAGGQTGETNTTLTVEQLYALSNTLGDPYTEWYISNESNSITFDDKNSQTKNLSVTYNFTQQNFGFLYNFFDWLGVHTKTSTNRYLLPYDIWKISFSDLSLKFYYTPGCKITIYYLYSPIRPQTNVVYTTLTSTNDQTVNLTTQMKWSGMPGYICNNYYDISDVTKFMTSVTKPTGGHLDKDITLICNWTEIYKVIFDKVLSDANFSYDQSQYINKYANDTVDTPSEPTINTHKFIGWALDDSITAETAILDNNNGNQNCWTTIPRINDDQRRNGGVDTDGYEIIYYAVWQERDSVTINPSVADITIITFNTTPTAQDGLTYYFNRGLNKKVTLSINPNENQGIGYYINSVTGATGTITANDGYRSWVGNDITNTSNSVQSTTINLVYHKSLNYSITLVATEKEKTNLSTFGNDFTITSNGSTQHYSVGIYTSNNYYDSRTLGHFLNPGDSVTFTITCTNNNYYIAKAFIPNGTHATTGGYTNSATDSMPYTDTVRRAQLKTGYNENNISALISAADCLACTYTLTVPAGAEGLAFMGDANDYKHQEAYLVYEPFHCQIQLTNTNYTPVVSKTSTLTSNECLYTNGTPKIYRFFNDISLNSQHIECLRGSNNTNNVIRSISINDTINDFIYLTLWNGSNKINNLYYFLSSSPQTIGTYNYYLNHFSGIYIQPDASLLSTYHAPWNINVTWNNTDYKCIIILRLPEANEDSNTTETDTNEVGNKIYFNGSGWEYQNATDKNKKVYVKEITNLTSASTLNTTLQDVANSGYILKSIKKYRYNGDWNSSLTTTTVTRDWLDAGTATLPAGWTRSSSDTSNDILTLNQNNLTAGSVDYYIITYEEGLPIFYPDSENNPKRAIQLYWEGNRAIGLYYENTRLL